MSSRPQRAAAIKAAEKISAIFGSKQERPKRQAAIKAAEKISAIFNAVAPKPAPKPKPTPTPTPNTVCYTCGISTRMLVCSTCLKVHYCSSKCADSGRDHKCVSVWKN